MNVSFLRRLWNQAFDRRPIQSLVYAPSYKSGGVKSLYSVCGWLNRLGHCTILPFDGRRLANWFAHDCRPYDGSYQPDLVIYPEVYQPKLGRRIFHVCYTLGQFQPPQPHADLVVVKSRSLHEWVRAQQPGLPVALVPASISHATFGYDGRPKKDIICYMTRADKHPETATKLRERHGAKVVEIINRPEREVAEMLKDAKVFVWRGINGRGLTQEGAPRPPKEALVAGCVVVGLAEDLTKRLTTNFGVKCRDEEELLCKAGEALQMPMPPARERAEIRDSEDEARDWLALMTGLKHRLLAGRTHA